jgi:hypothetical protein
MRHKIGCAFIEDVQKLGGIVEIDGTPVGGKVSNRHFDKRSGKRGQATPGGRQSQESPSATATLPLASPRMSKATRCNIAEFQSRYNDRNSADIS